MRKKHTYLTRRNANIKLDLKNRAFVFHPGTHTAKRFGVSLPASINLAFQHALRMRKSKDSELFPNYFHPPAPRPIGHFILIYSDAVSPQVYFEKNMVTVFAGRSVGVETRYGS